MFYLFPSKEELTFTLFWVQCLYEVNLEVHNVSRVPKVLGRTRPTIAPEVIGF